jgi:hypothetical protein
MKRPPDSSAAVRAPEAIVVAARAQMLATPVPTINVSVRASQPGGKSKRIAAAALDDPEGAVTQPLNLAGEITALAAIHRIQKSENARSADVHGKTPFAGPVLVTGAYSRSAISL